MSNQDPADGCWRCKDYDDVKSELDDLKDKTRKDNESALEDCECTKSKLQKKLQLLTLAVVASGTILGQEFVQGVISHFNGAKDVIEAVENAVSMAPPTSVNVQQPAMDKPEPEKEEDEEEEKEDPKKEKTPFTPYGGVGPAVVASLSDYGLSDDILSGVLMEDPYTLGIDPVIATLDFEPMSSMLIPPIRDLGMTDFALDPLIDFNNGGYVPASRASVIPEPPVIFFLLGATLLRPFRRR